MSSDFRYCDKSIKTVLSSEEIALHDLHAGLLCVCFMIKSLPKQAQNGLLRRPAQVCPGCARAETLNTQLS